MTQSSHNYNLFCRQSKQPRQTVSPKRPKTNQWICPSWPLPQLHVNFVLVWMLGRMLNLRLLQPTLLSFSRSCPRCRRHLSSSGRNWQPCPMQQCQWKPSPREMRERNTLRAEFDSISSELASLLWVTMEIQWSQVAESTSERPTPLKAWQTCLRKTSLSKRMCM